MAQEILQTLLAVVVMEATGDISVLHGKQFDPALLDGVSWGSETPPAQAAPNQAS